MTYKTLEQHFADLHNNPPAPFNPAYDPQAVARSAAVASMERDGLYQSMPREGRATEYGRRYDAAKRGETI